MDDDDDWDFDDLGASEPDVDASISPLNLHQVYAKPTEVQNGSAALFSDGADSGEDDDWLNSASVETGQAASAILPAGSKDIRVCQHVQNAPDPSNTATATGKTYNGSSTLQNSELSSAFKPATSDEGEVKIAATAATSLVDIPAKQSTALQTLNLDHGKLSSDAPGSYFHDPVPSSHSDYRQQYDSRVQQSSSSDYQNAQDELQQQQQQQQQSVDAFDCDDDEDDDSWGETGGELFAVQQDGAMNLMLPDTAAAAVVAAETSDYPSRAEVSGTVHQAITAADFQLLHHVPSATVDVNHHHHFMARGGSPASWTVNEAPPSAGVNRVNGVSNAAPSAGFSYDLKADDAVTAVETVVQEAKGSLAALFGGAASDELLYDSFSGQGSAALVDSQQPRAFNSGWGAAAASEYHGGTVSIPDTCTAGYSSSTSVVHDSFMLRHTAATTPGFPTTMTAANDPPSTHLPPDDGSDFFSSTMTAAAHDSPSYASGGGCTSCTAGWIPAGAAADGADFFASTSPPSSSSVLLDHFTSSSSATTAITAVTSRLASHHYRGDSSSVPVAAESMQSGINVQQSVAAVHQNKQATTTAAATSATTATATSATTTATATMESAALSVSGMTAMMSYGGHQAPAAAAAAVSTVSSPHNHPFSAQQDTAGSIVLSAAVMTSTTSTDISVVSNQHAFAVNENVQISQHYHQQQQIHHQRQQMMMMAQHQRSPALPSHAAVDDDDMSFFDSLAVTSAAANDDDVGMSSTVPTASSQQRPAAAAAGTSSIVTTAAAAAAAAGTSSIVTTAAAAAAAGTSSIVTTAAAAAAAGTSSIVTAAAAAAAAGTSSIVTTAAAAREEDALNFYHRSDDEHHYVVSNGGGGGDVFTDYDESSSSRCPPAQAADCKAERSVDETVDEVDVASTTYQPVDELVSAARNSSSSSAGQDSSKQINSRSSSSSPPLKDETSSNSVRPAAAAAAESYQQYDDAGLLLLVGSAGTTITSSAMSMTGGGNMLPSLHHQPENPPSSSQHDSVTTTTPSSSQQDSVTTTTSSSSQHDSVITTTVTTQHSPSLLSKDPLIQVAPAVAAYDSITTVPAAVITTTTMVESTSSSDWETYLWQVAQQQPTLEQQQALLEQWAALYGEEYAQYCLQQVQQHLLVLSNYQQQTSRTGIDQQNSSHVVQDNDQDPASSGMMYSVAEGLQCNNQQYHYDGLGGQVGASAALASRQLQEQQLPPITNLAGVNETGLMGNAAAAAAIDYGKPMQQQSLCNENYQWTAGSTSAHQQHSFQHYQYPHDDGSSDAAARQQWDQGDAVSAAAAVASESSLLTVYGSTLTSTESAPGSSSSNYATSMLHHHQQQHHYHGTASQQPQLYSSSYNQFHGRYRHPAPDHSMTQPPYNDLMPWPAATSSGASSSTSFTSAAAAAAVSNPYGSTPYVMTTPGSGTAGSVVGFGHNTTSNNNSIYEQQQWQQQQLRQVGTSGLPVNAQAARTCPNGRPSCPIVSFGFGGTVVLIRPVTNNEDAATISQHQPSSSFNLLDAGAAAVSPHVTVTSVPKLLDFCLKALVPVVAASSTGFTHYHDGSFATTSAAPGLVVGGMTNRDLTAGGGGSTADAAGSDLMSMEETVRLLSTYPGPLGPSSSREKILKYIKERCQQQEPCVASTAFNGVHTAAQKEPSHLTSVEHNEVMMTTLWSVLAALVNVPHHHGTAAAAAAAGISSTAAAAIGGAAASALRLLGLGQQKESGTLESELVQALKALTSHQYTLSSAGPAKQLGTSAAAAAAAAAAGTMSSWLQPVVGWSGCGQQRQQDLLRQAPGSNVLAPVLPVEEQLREAAGSVQALLVRGDKLAAFKEAVSASLWGPALLLGSSLGEKYYSEAACALALSGMSPGAPLRTLALIMAGRADLAVQGGTRTAAAAAASPPFGHSEVVATGGGTLDPVLQQWASNLAVLAGHRGLPGVMEAVAALGDRLNVEEGQALASHICYAVAGLSPGFLETIEAATTKTGAEVTDTGTRPSTASNTTASAIGSKQGVRYCLLGADACLQPRTYANLLAIQRTEVLEWALRAAGAVAGASTLNRSGSATPTGLGPGGQHSTAAAAAAAAAAAESWSLLLLPLQPYKLLYAHMLAECGLVSEALTYCQALDSALKMAPGNRVPPGFVVLARELEGLRERLLAFATARSLPMSTASGGADTTAASGNKGETSLNKIGKFLDGTLNKLLWGGSTAQPSQQQQEHTQAAGIPFSGAGYPASGPTSTGQLLTNTSIVSGSTTPTSRVSGGGGGSAAGVPFVAYGGDMAQHHHLSASAFTPAASSAAGTPHMHMSPSPSNNSLSSYASVPAAGPHLYGGTMANSYFVPYQAAAVGAHRRFPSSDMPGDTAPAAINDPNHSLNPAASLIAVASVAPVQAEDARQSGSGAPESSFAAAAAAAGTQSQCPSSFNPYHNVSAPPSSSVSSATPLTNQSSAALLAHAPVLAAGTEVNTTSSIPSVGGTTAGVGEEAGVKSSGPPSSSNRGSGISSFLGSLFGGRGSVDSGSSTVGQKRDPLDTASEDTIYYDKARGRWVTRGEEDAVEDTPLPPPPTSSSGAAGGSAAISAASAAAIAPLTTLPSSSAAAAAGTAALPPTGIMATSTAAAAAIGARTTKPRGGGVGSRYVDTFSHPPLIPGTAAAAAAAVPAPSISLPPRPPPGRFFVPGSQSSSSATVPNPAEPRHASSSSSPSPSHNLYHSSAFDTTSANSNLFAHYQGGDRVTSSSYSATAVVDQHDHVRLGQREALTTPSHTTPDHTLENRILDAPSSRRRSGAEEGAPGSTRSEFNPGNLQPLLDSSRSLHFGSSELSESASNGDCTVAFGSNEGRGSQFLHATPALHVYTSPVKEQTLLSTSAVGAAVSPPIHVASPYDEIYNQGYSGWTYGVYDSSQECAHDVRNEVPNPSLHCQGGCNILNNQQLGDENQTHADVPSKDVISDASIKYFDGLEAEELKEVEL
ncbi:hypothetical protein CEUSTIGMA_g8504.t1 [Chlamydomonas eustigma]|uniref:Sec16 Sec23-binding domain-containing protein n=1 Tax=Chlamydomonas eustigma TaxID=1157962 RepID=A0A250XDS5_9CHLO|nr:hypothetical protein CEUSTIGMA_g8504.t1 [Chlamydomonas eustigma]|eukprot:GAX81069.1 hypothetical protein CEUSTIGMA_g8504.t1 [Chlamydomonas eustigma]